MFCSKCGHQNPEGSSVCANCGESFFPAQPQYAVPQSHNVPKCTCCGAIGEMKPGPLLRGKDILWILMLMFFAGAGFIYLIFILIMRANPKKREQICKRCNSKNMLTYVY